MNNKEKRVRPWLNRMAEDNEAFVRQLARKSAEVLIEYYIPPEAILDP